MNEEQIKEERLKDAYKLVLIDTVQVLTTELHCRHSEIQRFKEEISRKEHLISNQQHEIDDYNEKIKELEDNNATLRQMLEEQRIGETK